MAKGKSAVKKKNARQSQKSSPDPEFASVGLPKVPALYQLKPRTQYLPWSHAVERLEKAKNYWICTVRPDGRPHSIPVWGFWLENAFYFGTARETRKEKNLTANPALAVHLESGDDVVILEGVAAEIKDDAILKKLDAASRGKYQMPLMIMPESVLYRVCPRVVLAWTEKGFPKDATRWELKPSH